MTYRGDVRQNRHKSWATSRNGERAGRSGPLAVSRTVTDQPGLAPVLTGATAETGPRPTTAWSTQVASVRKVWADAPWFRTSTTQDPLGVTPPKYPRL